MKSTATKTSAAHAVATLFYDAIQTSEDLQWRMALAAAGQFVVHVHVVFESTNLHRLAVEELVDAGWSVLEEHREPLLRFSLLEPEPERVATSSRSRSTLEIARVVPRRFSPTVLQPLQDDLSFRLATLGASVVFFKMERVRPESIRTPRWGLVHRSGAPRTKDLLTLQAEHLTVGDRVRSAQAWTTIVRDAGPVDADFGANGIGARNLDKDLAAQDPRTRRRVDLQSLVTLILVAALGPLAVLVSAIWDTPPAEELVLGAGLAISVLIAIAAATTWKAKKRVTPIPYRQAIRSWATFAGVAGAMSTLLFAFLVVVVSMFDAPPVLVLLGLVAAVVLTGIGVFFWNALARARRLRPRETPWLVLVTSFGIVLFIVLLNVPSALFLWAVGDPALVGSLPIGEVLASGAPFVAGLTVLAATPAFVRRLLAAAPTLLAIPAMVAATAAGFSLFIAVDAWEAGATVAGGSSQTGPFIPTATSVCASIGDASEAPYWLLGSQGASVHLVPRDVGDAAVTTGDRSSITIASSDTRFVSVDAQDDCG